LTEILISLASGRQIAFDVSCDLAGPAYFVFSVRKCGSSIFNSICQAVAENNGRHFVPVADTFFWKNVSVPEYVNDPALLDIVRPGNVYAGFRDMPTIFLSSEIFRQSPKLLMIRDPRDALVSLYFSIAYSHSVPEGNAAGSEVTKHLLKQRQLALSEEIDVAVIRLANAMAKTMLEYARIIDWNTTTVLKYEDYILDKRALITTIARTFEWSIDERLIGHILSWSDVRPPEVEDPRAFVRKVTPGDHREKLKPATIATLNTKLADAMKLFAYVP
jgi:hypothetical protein